MDTPNVTTQLAPAASLIKELASIADASTEELQEICRIPDDLYKAAARAGLFRQLIVADLSGMPVTPLEWFQTGVDLARHEASFGWVITQGAAEMGWVGAGGDQKWVEEMLQDPLAVSATTIAGRGLLSITGDRSRFGGRWAFNTGCQGATWLGGITIVEGEVNKDGTPEVRMGLVPAERAEIVEDWNPSGLRGTGSHSIIIPEQEIPTMWTFSPWSPTQNDRGPYRCLVGNGNWPIATSVAATQLGNARRALDEARIIFTQKKSAPEFVLLATNAAVQRGLAEAEGLWHAAIASVERELESMWAEANTHAELSKSQRVRLHSANVTANQLSVRIVDTACELTGTSSVARRHILSRCQRDAHALRGHISVNGTSMERNAKVSLGLLDMDGFV